MLNKLLYLYVKFVLFMTFRDNANNFWLLQKATSVIHILTPIIGLTFFTTAN